jgi:hypothetical protein
VTNVTQEDREAAAELIDALTGSKSASSMKMRRGEADDYTEVLAFARQREQARADALVEAARVQPKTSETFSYQADGYATGWKAGIDAMRTAIRAMIPAPPDAGQVGDGAEG